MDDLIQEALPDVEGRGPRKAFQYLEDLGPSALSPADRANQDADRAMYPNTPCPRRQAGGGVVREEDRALVRQSKPDRGLLPAVQGERSDQYF